MMSEIDAIVAKNWTVDGQKVSLFDVGYGSVGIDEGNSNTLYGSGVSRSDILSVSIFWSIYPVRYECFILLKEN